MTMPLVILAIGAVFAGFLGLPGVLGGSQFAHWLEPVIHAHEAEHASHALEWGLMALSVSVAGVRVFPRLSHVPARGAVAGYFRQLSPAARFYRLFDHKWYFDEIYQVVFVNGTFAVGAFLSAFDKYIVDGIVNGAAALVRFLSWLNGLFDHYVIDGFVNAVAEHHVSGSATNFAACRPATSIATSTAF